MIVPDGIATAGPWMAAIGIALATFVNEDLTCIAVGLLVAAGKIEWLPGLAGCFVGIVLGDFGVWCLGRLAGTRVLRWRWVRRVLTTERLEKLSVQLCERGGIMAFISRCIPGSRVPLFLTAGILGYCPTRFLTWAFVAAAVWTPMLVFSVALVGDSILQLDGFAIVGIVVSAYLAMKVIPGLFNTSGRARFMTRASRIWRWEFWPAWIFYVPLVPWYFLLGLRYRSFTLWTAANPAIPAGGVVGESKIDILAALPPEFIVPSEVIPPATGVERLNQFRQVLTEHGWPFPLVLKPNAGQRGAGVRKIRDMVEAEKYLQDEPGTILVQPYHPGPCEAGIFYYRFPSDSTGRIFSITDKVFPVVTGDGHSTLAELIEMHPRYRMQATLFLERHSAMHDRIIAPDEPFPLAMAGNHCQGTLFRDGRALITPELERAVDDIARRFVGFYFGRFDVRYTNADDLRAGKNFAVVELNGATSESTNLYDPAKSLVSAYGVLFRQWSLAFRIGAENRRRGHRPVGLFELFRILIRFYRERGRARLAD